MKFWPYAAFTVHNDLSIEQNIEFLRAVTTPRKIFRMNCLPLQPEKIFEGEITGEQFRIHTL